MSLLDYTELRPLGAEVKIDLSDDQPADVITELNRLYSKYHLLVFRDQSLSREQQYRATTWFGPALPLSDVGSGYVSNTRPDGVLGSAEIKFHSDQASCPLPLDGVMLHAIEMDGGTSITRFVDTADAYRRLSPDMKQRIAGLHAVHAMSYDAANPDRLASLNDPLAVRAENRGADQDHHTFDPEMPSHAHPIVRIDTRTGEPCLYVNEEWTKFVVELPSQKSNSLLCELIEHILLPEYIYEHVWKLGDVVLWDNQALLHARGSIGHMRRTLQRTQLGQKGVVEQRRADFTKEDISPLG